MAFLVRFIDLSCDLGEGSSPEEWQIEERLWPLISAANVACGGHAGDRNSMELAVHHAQLHGVLLGAHPSYPDRIHFGRLSVEIDHDELCRFLIEQIEELHEIALDDGLQLQRVKAHGALYNDAHRDPALAKIVVAAAGSVDRQLALVAAPGSAMLKAAESAGMSAIREAFIDRRYRADGSLQPRSEAGALLLDIHEAADQAVMLACESSVISADGRRLAVPFDTLCIHGDMPDAVARLEESRRKLKDAGFAIGRESR
ncbi:MAG: 5-oxoprolinase subunit PxpA [Acidobacteriota bacterium]